MRLRLILIVLMLLALPSALCEEEPTYEIVVDINNQIVTVYEGSEHTSPAIVRQMLCSTGRVGNRTITGSYTLPKKHRSAERTAWYWFSDYDCWGGWATRIKGGYLFHSVPYTEKKAGATDPHAVAAIGWPASHGCIRLMPEDARWIAINCDKGTRVELTDQLSRNDGLRSRLFALGTFSASAQSYSDYLGTDISGIVISDTLGEGASAAFLNRRLYMLGWRESDSGTEFDEDTVRAVMAVQDRLGLDNTGVADAELQELLMSDEAPVHIIQRGYKGWPVYRMQCALRELGYYREEPSGEFDRDTRHAVEDYCEAAGIEYDDRVDGELLRQILAEAGMQYRKDL